MTRADMSLATRQGGPARRVAAALLGLMLALVLAGCAAIPTGGGVRAGGKIQEQAPPGVDYRPNGPTKNADQSTILREFIDAATGDQDNYAIAREFLSNRFAQRWNPRQSVMIRTGTGTIGRIDDNHYTYTMTASATVDASGEYTPSVRPAFTTLSFQFVKEGGQWRISYAPDGIVLSPVSFASVFQAHPLYFYDPSHKYLVPDERWFLARSSTSTRIVSALLDGPSPWLKSAVVSAFPEGTQLSLNAVTTANGTAQVDLTSDALKATAVEKAWMREQLAQSLSSVASISSVDITVEGTSLAIPPAGGAPPLRDPDVDPRPVVAANQTVGYATPGTAQVAPVPNVGAKIAALAPAAIELTQNDSAAAVLTADGAYFVRGGSTVPLRVDTRPDLIAPSIDEDGYLWSGQSTDPGSIIAFDAAGGQHPIASTLPSGTLVAFAVSRDSSRALALLNTTNGAALYVMGIVRNTARQPTAFTTPIRVQVASGTPLDAAWQSDLSIASIGQTQSGVSVVSATIGGDSSTLPKPAGTATTVTGGSSDSILLRMSDGSILAQSGGGWDSTGITADVLATQR